MRSQPPATSADAMTATQSSGVVDVTGGRTLTDVVNGWAAVRGSETLLCFEDAAGAMHELTWSDVAERVGDLRRRLAALGVGPDDVVVLCLSNSPAFHLLWLAISSNGAAILPLDPKIGALRLRRLISVTGAHLVVTTPERAPGAAEVLEDVAGGAVLVVEDETVASPAAAINGWQGESRTAPEPTSNRDVAGLLQTSGSTGEPKLVELTHANYIYSGESLARNGALGADDRAFIALPLFHGGAQLYSTMTALVTGASIGYVPHFSASGYMPAVVRTESTWGLLFGPIMRMILMRSRPGPHGTVDTGHLRVLYYAQSLANEEWDRWEQTFGDVGPRHIYGQTEAVAVRIGHTPWSTGPQGAIGLPFVDTAVRLVDDEGYDVASGEVGEALIHGEPGVTLMRGYRGRPDLTARTIVDGWLRTGDKLRRRPDGAFEFVARASHIVKRAGENISLPELDLLMIECPLVMDVAVAAQDDDLLGQRLVAFVIPTEGYSHDKFLAWCDERLGRTGRPDEVVELDEFPRTSLGKIQKHLLRAPSREGGATHA